MKITGLLNSQRTDSLPPLFSQGPTGACICENLCYLFIEEQTIVLEFFLLVFYAQSKLKKKKRILSVFLCGNKGEANPGFKKLSSVPHSVCIEISWRKTHRDVLILALFTLHGELADVDS